MENFEVFLPDRPIAFNRDFVRLGAGITGALFLSQALYWEKRASEADGSFYKTIKEWEEETGLTRKEQLGIKRKLEEKGFITIVKKGLPAKNYFWVNKKAIVKALLEIHDKWRQEVTTSGDKRAPLEETKGHDTLLQRLHTESTTDTPPENPGGSESKDIQSILERFYRINPSLSFGKKPERDACRQLLKKHKTIEETLRICDYVLSIQGQPFAPVVTSPLELWKKYAKVAIFHQRDTKRNNNVRQA